MLISLSFWREKSSPVHAPFFIKILFFFVGKKIRALKGLQMVVQSIGRSLPDMGNILLLLFIVMFIFSVVAVDLFGSDPLLDRRFGSIPKCMFSLYVLMTMVFFFYDLIINFSFFIYYYFEGEWDVCGLSLIQSLTKKNTPQRARVLLTYPNQLGK